MQEATVAQKSEKIFTDVREVEITRAIANEFHEVLIDRAESDVIIIGAGPAGLTASRDLSNMGFKVLVIEQNNYLGGGYWLGGYMMNPVTVREPAQKIWDELGVPYKKVMEGLYLTPGPHAVSKLIAGACDAGVKFLNLTKFDDLVLKNGRVEGIVVNWMPVSALPRNITCVDPIALEAKIIIDSSGHDSVAVKRLVDRGLVDWKGMNPMYVNEGEEHVVEKTGEVYPGLIAAGMSVTETHGLARMGPTFGYMLFSGKKAAEIAAEKIKELERYPITKEIFY
jgi:thiamine thiazole synthase